MILHWILAWLLLPFCPILLGSMIIIFKIKSFGLASYRRWHIQTIFSLLIESCWGPCLCGKIFLLFPNFIWTRSFIKLNGFPPRLIHCMVLVWSLKLRYLRTSLSRSILVVFILIVVYETGFQIVSLRLWRWFFLEFTDILNIISPTKRTIPWDLIKSQFHLLWRR